MPLAAFGLLVGGRRRLGLHAPRRRSSRARSPTSGGGSTRSASSPRARPRSAQPATYGGPALAALALVGLAARRRAGDGGSGSSTAAVLASGLVLMLGPTLPAFPLYEALHRWLPLFAMIRNPRKLELLVAVGSLVLAAFGARAVLGRLAAASARRRLMVAGVLTGLVLVATPPWHGIAVARFGDSPVFEALRHGATRVLYLPIWPGDSAYSSLYLYAITRTRVPAVNGYSPFVPAALRARRLRAAGAAQRGGSRPGGGVGAPPARRVARGRRSSRLPASGLGVPVGLHDPAPPRLSRARARARGGPALALPGDR